jgi:hypothetical protein
MRDQISRVRRTPAPARTRSIPTVLGLTTASLVCLCAGALLAFAFEGVPRVLFAVGGFIGFLFFLSHALKELGMPSTLSGNARGGEAHRRRASRVPRGPAVRNRDLTIAA